MRKTMIFSALILAAAFTAAAQEPDTTGAMTLHDCMEYAMSSSTKMRISEADRNDEQALR